jgi:hypothetical protein
MEEQQIRVTDIGGPGQQTLRGDRIGAVLASLPPRQRAQLDALLQPAHRHEIVAVLGQYEDSPCDHQVASAAGDWEHSFGHCTPGC